MTSPTPPCACPPGYEDGGCVFPPGTCGRPRRTLRPPRAHDWQEYMDGKIYCAACGLRRGGVVAQQPCWGAGKETVDVE